MEYNNFVENMLESYLKQLSKKAIFIKYYNSLKETVTMIQDKLGEEADSTFLYHSFKVGEIKGAYEPFLAWIKDIYNMFYANLYTVEQFVGVCGIYELQKEVFIEYIKTGVCKRCEDVMIEEFGFEREEMLKSMYNIFSYVSKYHPLVFVISNVHMASYSTLRLINHMIDKDDEIRFVFSYNDSFLVRDYIKNEWNKLIRFAEVNKMIPEWSKLYIEVDIDYQDDFIYDETRIEEYCDIANNMYYMLTLADANYYLGIIFDEIFKPDSMVDDNIRLQITSIYAMVNLGLENCNEALFICENMVPIYSRANNVLYEYYYNYLSALAHLLMIESELTFKFCDRCRALIEILPENTRYSKERCRMNIDIIECLSRFGSLKEVFKCNYNYNANEEIINKIKDIKYENFLAYMYIFGYDNDEESVRQIATGERKPEYFNKGIEIATRIGNINLLMRAYMKNIILYSENGYHKYVRSMYEKRIALTPKENRIRRAHSYSGMGYNSIVLEEYAEADRYFRNSIEVLVDEQKAEDIAETLYNMSINYYIAGAYSMAAESMETVLKIMELIGVEGIRICNTTKLYGILALSYYRLKRYYDVYYYINKMEAFLGHILYKENSDYKLWEEDLFLYYINRAVMSQYEGNMDESACKFDKAYMYMNMLKGAKFYSVVEYALLRADYYEENGNQLMRYKVLSEAYKYYDENRYPLTKNKIEAAMENREFEVDTEFAKVYVDFEGILKVATHAGSLINLQKKEKDINFISLCQEVLVRENSSANQVVDNTMNIIQNTFNIDKLLLLERKENRCMLCYSYGNISLGENDIEDIFEFFDSHRVEFLSNRIDKDYMLFKPIAEKFGVDDIVTIIGIPVIKMGKITKIFIGVVDIHRNFTGNRILLKKNNLTIIKCVINQLDEAVRRIKNGKMLMIMNERLKEATVTDQLTGIYNRQGYKKVIEDQEDKSGIVMFMDVDNFKYYNDTFGHSAGDEVLKQFARTITEYIGKEGKAIRYGGDEFLVILPDTSEEEGKEVAQCIIDNFQEILSKTIIIDNQRVGCSIGISSYFGGVTDNVEMALKYADKALYEVKNNVKGKFAVWSEISE